MPNRLHAIWRFKNETWKFFALCPQAENEIGQRLGPRLGTLASASPVQLLLFLLFVVMVRIPSSSVKAAATHPSIHLFVASSIHTNCRKNQPEIRHQHYTFNHERQLNLIITNLHWLTCFNIIFRYYSPLDFTTTERSVDTFQLVTVVLVSIFESLDEWSEWNWIAHKPSRHLRIPFMAFLLVLVKFCSHLTGRHIQPYYTLY